MLLPRTAVSSSFNSCCREATSNETALLAAAISLAVFSPCYPACASSGHPPRKQRPPATQAAATRHASSGYPPRKQRPPATTDIGSGGAAFVPEPATATRITGFTTTMRFRSLPGQCEDTRK